VLTQQAVSAVGIGPGAWTAISLLRFPLVLVLVALAVAVLFHFGPDVRVSFRWTLTGGIVFAVGWVVVTVLFGLYVANFGSYANTYGALGGVIVLMPWFYLTALILLVAAEVVSMLAAAHQPEHLECRRAQTRSSEGRPAQRASQKDKGAEVPEPRAPGEPRVEALPAGNDRWNRDRRNRDGRGAAGPASHPMSLGAFQKQPAGGGAFTIAVLAIGAIIGAIAGRKVGEDD
jgi:hypothetical protein